MKYFPLYIRPGLSPCSESFHRYRLDFKQDFTHDQTSSIRNQACLFHLLSSKLSNTLSGSSARLLSGLSHRVSLEHDCQSPNHKSPRKPGDINTAFSTLYNNVFPSSLLFLPFQKPQTITRLTPFLVTVQQGLNLHKHPINIKRSPSYDLSPSPKPPIHSQSPFHQHPKWPPT